MKKAVLTLVAAGAFSVAASAQAQQTAAERLSRPPNVPLVVAGSAMLIGAYVPSFIVAAASPNSNDRWLFMPVFGPWFDIATRGCAGDCTAEVANKFLLIGNGVVQGLGAAAIVAGYFLPPKATPFISGGKRDNGPKWQITPMQMGHGPSLGAGVVGTF